MLQDDMQVIDEMSSLTGIKYSDEQIEILKHRGGMCILACAGSGKTSILTHLLAKRIKTGEIKSTKKLLCTTYSKAGAVEMEERLDALLKRLGIQQRVEVKTLHASYYRILKDFNILKNICSGGQRIKFITESCRENGVMLADEDLQLIDSLLSFQINNLMSDSDLEKSYVYTLEDVPISKFRDVRRSYSEKKEAAGVMDFDDMQLFMYTMLVQQKRKDVLDYCRSLWSDFFIDEFQDTSKIQFAILRELVTDPNKLIVIGDDDQCIYEWRGADPNIILNICGYYDIQRFLLSTNYRCGGEIVKHAAVGILNNEKRAEKTMLPYNEGGKISIKDIGEGNLFDMTKHAFDHIKKLVDTGTKPSDISVLSRNNQHLSILINMLFDNGIYCKSVPEMRMTQHTMYKDLKDVMGIAAGTYDKNLVKRSLWKCCSFLGVKGAGLVAAFMDSTGATLKDSLGYMIKNYGTSSLASSIEWSGRIKIPVQAADKIEYMFQCLNGDVEYNLIQLYKTLTVEDDAERTVRCFRHYLEGTSFMYKSMDRMRNIYGLSAYLKDLITRKGLDETISFLRMSEQYESDKAGVPGDKVIMSTMHGAKGREWKHVLLFADDNITFPSFEGISNMLMKGNAVKDISGSIDENRRLHYVAMTRAKEDLVIMADLRKLSVYALEALGIINKQDSLFNGHIINMADGNRYAEIGGEELEALSSKLGADDSQYKYEF